MTSLAPEQNDNLPSLLEWMSDAFIELDDDLRITAVNSHAASLLREPRSDLIGQQLREVLAPETADVLTEELEHAATHDEPATFDVTEDETERVLEVRAYPLESGVALYFADATRRSRAEVMNEQLQLLNRIMRHDIRNDMNVVIGWTRELESHVDQDGKAILERIERTSQHAVDLTMLLRDFLQALAVDGTTDLEPIDVSDALQEELTTRRATYPRATFTADGDLPSVTILANELLSSVFRNLLNNAAQHNDTPRPRVSVGVETDTDTVRIRIADNGPGIVPERADTIFGRTGEGLDAPGTGIGLYLVDTLVSQYHGHVWYEPNEPRGTVFIVELPVVDATLETNDRGELDA